MKNLLLALLLVLPSLVAEQTVRLTPENTQIEWTLTDPLHTVRGTFKLKQGSITFDTDSGKASGQIVVDVKSGESGNGSRDGRMHANVLESNRYPEAIFTPNRVEGRLAPQGVSSLKLHGTLQIHGQPHEVTMNAEANTSTGQTDISLAIPYVAWGMKDPGNFLLKVGKSVQMKIHINAEIHP